MDVRFFLNERTAFIRRFYENAAAPFSETKRKIEAGDAPFDNPPNSEDGEAPFLDQWADADESLEVLGRACISMLSASLHLYFKTWESELRVTWQPGERKKAFRKGFLHGYRECFGDVLNLSWHDCPADFALLEQVVLARHRDQHPDHISTMRVHHTSQDRTKYPSPFFASDIEKQMFPGHNMPGSSWMNPAVYVSPDMLYAAITQVETLAEWLEERMLAAKYG